MSCGGELVLEGENYPFLLPDSSSKHVSTDTTFFDRVGHTVSLHSFSFQFSGTGTVTLPLIPSRRRYTRTQILRLFLLLVRLILI